MSVVPTQHPNNTYHIWCIHLGKGRKGLDHILTTQEHIHPAWSSGIDHEISSVYLKSDHYLIYIFFTLSCPDTAPIPHVPKPFHYRRVVQIILIKTYSEELTTNSPPWFAPKTPSILPNDVRSHTKIHGSLALTHKQSKAQHHLRQASQWSCGNLAKSYLKDFISLSYLLI